MAWIIGIDEAGYGPNLGPLVMTSVACCVPDALTDADLWHVLKTGVKRRPTRDSRVLIQDSKLIHCGPNAFKDLETQSFCLLLALQAASAEPLDGLLRRICPGSVAGLCQESWYVGSNELPVVACRRSCQRSASRLARTSLNTQVRWGPLQSVVICPGHFNQLLERWGSKGAVLGEAFAELARFNLEALSGESSIHFFVDKHGGRNSYASLVQHAFAPGMAIAAAEGAQLSAYQVLGLPADVKIAFKPRADAEHLCVAIASMISKYVRELLMLDFNAFWLGHVPGIRKTAGYPTDAARFFEEIGPVAARLNIPTDSLWRRR